MASRSLLGYPLRKAAQSEMLHGGVRLSYLVARPPPMKLTKSEELVLPTPRQEREDMELEYTHVGQRLLPVNIGQRIRVDMDVIRAKDVYRRFMEKERGQSSKFIAKAKDLSIFPTQQKESIAAEVFGAGKRFMPLQMVKPKASLYSVATRGTGVRSTRGQLYQERLDGKGFGWKRKARSLWQQDIDTNGFRPHRYF
ncbi:Hypothetical protein, putative [Bodo saltans]|uniref:Uncharacterized protein n=1 Tax=Bodo saltans TaxID=75058 RepID=A0A0S4KGQ4_BODSA|nr:Hypothetical protein, putative [Bodo saltans]|eukprot:CUI14158.1 Hypothetical protein, putative [Bodo saltans]